MEIERKFLLDSLPHFPKEDDNILKTTIFQSYLCLYPEIRIREVVKSYANQDIYSYFLTVKSNGDLVRKETELAINYEDYFQYYRTQISEPILKEETRFKLLDGHLLECSIVEKGTDNSFIYREIEFNNIEEANHYVPSFAFIKEITNDSNYKMKNVF